MTENCRVNDCQKRLLIAERDALVRALRECCRRLKMDLDEIRHLREWLSDSERAERATQDEAADEASEQAIAEADRVLSNVGTPRK